MPDTVVTAIAHPNIAFIKYWGNRDAELNLPLNGSISMNLARLETRTTVQFDPAFPSDELILNGEPAGDPACWRASRFLDHIRRRAGMNTCARITSENNFPAGAGIASSASGFAALALAGSHAAGLDLSEMELSRLARLGSGSACRSIPTGFAEWQMGDDETSYAFSIAGPGHWEVVDCIAVVSEGHKPTGSSEGHGIAESSPLQEARVEGALKRLEACRQAIALRDFEGLARVTELDSNLMHAVMQTSNPPLLYWQAATVEIMHWVREWRDAGLPVFYTIDAGPNVHVFTWEGQAGEVARRLAEIPGVVKVIQATPGGAARLLEAA